MTVLVICGQAPTVAVVDDHEIIGHGLKLAFEQDLPEAQIVCVPSVRQLLGDPNVAVLDLRLSDDTTPAENLAVLTARGVPVVAYTSGDNPDLVREAVAHGVLAVVRKSAPIAELVDAVKDAARGEITANVDWAASVDADEDFVADRLTDTEAEVLALYAAGELAGTVARKLGMAPASVNTYVCRIRSKYRDVGRKAESRVDLFLRAAEDGLISYYG